VDPEFCYGKAKGGAYPWALSDFEGTNLFVYITYIISRYILLCNYIVYISGVASERRDSQAAKYNKKMLEPRVEKKACIKYIQFLKKLPI
jgi:hypothetical protein